MLEITGGSLKGRKVITTPRAVTRYTPNMVRKALFDIIDIEGKSLLDVCSGSGVISFEAISRGASDVVSIDSSYKSIKTIKENIRNLGIKNKIKIYCKDFRIQIPQLDKKEIKFDFIFFDPPFNKGYMGHIFKTLIKSNVLKCEGLLIIESSVSESKGIENLISDSFKIINTKKYGNVFLTFLKINTMK